MDLKAFSGRIPPLLRLIRKKDRQLESVRKVAYKQERDRNVLDGSKCQSETQDGQKKSTEEGANKTKVEIL